MAECSYRTTVEAELIDVVGIGFDGMLVHCVTVDEAGDMWVAIYEAGQVHRYSPDGELRHVVAVPADQTMCCGFAGPGLNRLYVTTATENWSDDRRRADPAAGLVHWSVTDASGVPAAAFRPDIDWWKAMFGVPAVPTATWMSVFSDPQTPPL
jgi:hypothetical protein